ncbi:hypothetical protein AAHH84_00215 [Candidatus Hodgkinia cicadicola]
MALAQTVRFKLVAANALATKSIGVGSNSGSQTTKTVDCNYSVYTKRFDKTITRSSLNQSASPKLELGLGHIEAINRKRIWQVLVDANLVLTRLVSASHKAAASLNFIVDKSLSMLSKQWLVAKLIKSVAKLAPAPSYEIVGYTTRHWRYSNAFKLWKQATTSLPGRVNDVLYIRYQQDANALEAQQSAWSKENIDGEAVLALAKTSCVNVLFNDNAPADFVTNSLNAPSVLVHHFEHAISLANANGVKLLVVNLGPVQLLPSKASASVGCRPSKHKALAAVSKALKLSTA